MSEFSLSCLFNLCVYPCFVSFALCSLSLSCTFVAKSRTGLIPDLSLFLLLFLPVAHPFVPIIPFSSLSYIKGVTSTLFPCFLCKVILIVLNQQRGEGPSGLVNNYKIQAKQSPQLALPYFLSVGRVRFRGLVKGWAILSIWLKRKY